MRPIDQNQRDILHKNLLKKLSVWQRTWSEEDFGEYHKAYCSYLKIADPDMAELLKI